MTVYQIALEVEAAHSVAVRDLANGIQVAIRKGQKAGLHPDVKVVGGPTVTTGGEK